VCLSTFDLFGLLLLKHYCITLLFYTSCIKKSLILINPRIISLNCFSISVPPISGLPPFDVVRTMSPFAAAIYSDYRQLTLANLTWIANLTADDTAIKNKYFGDLSTNRFIIYIFQYKINCIHCSKY
jgi:hypothetical protein